MPENAAHQNVRHEARPHDATHAHGAAHGTADRSAYLRLALALSISYVVMFAAMFARVNIFENVHISLNNAYMAGLMVAPMALIMLATMPKMFGHRTLNVLVALAAIGGAVLFFALIRMQAGIDDRQFLRSMIPHHAGAILVCERAALTDGDVRRLCRQIIESQQREIAEMNQMLAR